MELSNLETLPGRTIIRHLGLVQGSTVRSKHAGKDLLAGFKNFVGGELKAYTELLNESRQEAIDRMVQQAQAVGANAVIIVGRNMDFHEDLMTNLWTQPRGISRETV